MLQVSGLWPRPRPAERPRPSLPKAADVVLGDPHSTQIESAHATVERALVRARAGTTFEWIKAAPSATLWCCSRRQATMAAVKVAARASVVMVETTSAATGGGGQRPVLLRPGWWPVAAGSGGDDSCGGGVGDGGGGGSDDGGGSGGGSGGVVRHSGSEAGTTASIVSPQSCQHLGRPSLSLRRNPSSRCESSAETRLRL